jgi:uncharacterized protein YodC (DUF2158 family)
MAEIKAGDKARLKSGGPLMTVTHVGIAAYTEEETVWVSWFDDKGHLQTGTFPPAALEQAET